MLQFVQKARGYISGHVTKKPVMNNGASGKSFCTVSLAVNLPPYAGKDGTKIVPPAEATQGGKGWRGNGIQ